MENNDTKVLIDNDSQVDGTGSKRTEVTKSDIANSSQDIIAKLRNYNRQGPHFLYGSTTEPDRKSKPIRRLIRKSGKYNVSRNAESQIWDKYLRDFSHTLVNSRWRWTIIASTSSFLLSWGLFAVIWMLIANANGDLDLKSPTPTPCLTGIHGFPGYFLFSLETQATIGYGTRYISHHCPEAVFIMCLQIILGCAICGLMVNIVYLKMMKPLNKYSKRLFSKHAVICRRDGHLCLIFRVRDEDTKHAVATTVQAYLLRKEKSTEEPCLVTLPIEPHGFLIWPLEIIHKITKESPLWDISSYDLISDRFELIVQLQGTSPTTGQCTKTRSSYLSSEILWGHRFSRCVKYAGQNQAYVVSHKDFNVTQEHSIHLCSAKRFAEVFQYINVSPMATPDPTANLRRIEINIIHNRSTYLPAQSVPESVEKSEQSSLVNKRDSACDVSGGTRALSSNSQFSLSDVPKRRSQYDGVDDEELTEQTNLLARNNSGVSLLQHDQIEYRQNKEEYNFTGLNKLGVSDLSLATTNFGEIPLIKLSPGYDNVAPEPLMVTENQSHGNFLNPNLYAAASVQEGDANLGKSSSHYDVTQTIAEPVIAKSKSCHQFQNTNETSNNVYNLDINKLHAVDSNLSLMTTKTDVSRKLSDAELLDLDTILAYLEEYLEKNGKPQSDEVSLAKF